MPHALIAPFNLPSLPARLGEDTFEFISTPHKGSGIVGVRHDDDRFLLKYLQRDGNVLVKSDKTTRIPKLNVLKKAINHFCELTGSEVLRTNTAVNKKDRVYSNYKDLDFFLEACDYSKTIWVEVGFGSGRHLLHNAKNHPDIIHIGLEIHKPSAEQVLKQCELQGIDNLYVLDFDARIFLEILPANSVQKIFVHFPVPWDKAPHRRVISKGFVDEAVTVLEPGGTLELRTDSENYMFYSYGVFMELSSAELMVRKNHFLEVSSKYEDRWKKMNKNFYDLTLTNHLESEKKTFNPDFSFEGFVPFEEFAERLAGKAIVETDYLIGAKERYPLGHGEGLLKITMGAFGTPQSLYLLFRDNTVVYYPRTPYPTGASLKAHNRLQAMIHGTDNR